MSAVYNHKTVEKKWQQVWQDEKAFAATNDYSKPKYYALVEFPYPSGQGLHVGHPRPYTALDIVARKRRMQGYNVLYPMGWDAFGLPTENILRNSFSQLVIHLTGTERLILQILIIISGLSGFSLSFLRLDLHISRRCLSTGVLHVR